jgi:hypothetical protein
LAGGYCSSSFSLGFLLEQARRKSDILAIEIYFKKQLVKSNTATIKNHSNYIKKAQKHAS